MKLFQKGNTNIFLTLLPDGDKENILRFTIGHK